MTKTNNGFTLIETAVVLVIFGIMAGAAFSFTNAQLQQSRINSTKTKQDAIKTALINFIARNNRLPCPAVANLTPGLAGFGVEAKPQIQPLAPNCAGLTPTNNVVSGIVPFNSLGLIDEAVSDGFYNRITYLVTLSATSLTASTIPSMQGNIFIYNAAPPTGTKISVSPAGDSVVALISHGNNGYGAYSEAGVQRGLPTGADELANTNPDNKIVMRDYSTNDINPFDDIVLPLTPSDLLRSLQTIGAVEDPTAALNKSMTSLEANVIAKVSTSKQGQGQGQGQGQTYLVPLNITTINDPWGKQLIYAQKQPSIMASTAANTVVFQITSGGPDGSNLTIDNADDTTKSILAGQIQAVINNNPW